MIKINNLNTSFLKGDTSSSVVEDFSLEIKSGAITGLVGESGAGKSTVAFSILDLLKFKQGKISSGEILFNDINLLNLSESEKENIRGNKISMIFQEPFSYFNPTLNVGRQVIEPLIIHNILKKKEAYEKAEKLFNYLGIKNASQKLLSYPFEFSGGQLQRVMIAMALICEPDFLIADEPTTSLDELTKTQLLEIFIKLKNEKNLTMLIISHDLPFVSKFSDYIGVIYLGKIVEFGTAYQVTKTPMHPYTKALFSSFNLSKEWKEIQAIKGEIPDIANKPAGCYFHPRCPKARGNCKDSFPINYKKNNEHHCYCYYPEL